MATYTQHARDIRWALAAEAALIAFILTTSTQADTLTFYATGDATLDELYPNGNSGSSYKTVARNTGSGPWELDPLVRFDISSIPAGTSIESATLALYYFSWGDNNPAGRPLTCYRVTDDWEEMTVTWNTQPDRESEVTDVCVVPGSPGEWMMWDVTVNVRDFVDGTVPDYGWIIMDETYWGSSNIPYTKFYAKENGELIPYLEVKIGAPPCPADLTNDGVVDVDDLFVLLGYWGYSDSPADINDDGTVDVDDLFIVLNNWGPCP
jgi:hypothetical protein